MPYLCLFIEYFLNGADGTKEVRGFVRDINRFVVFTGYHLVECFDVFYGEEIGGRVGFCAVDSLCDSSYSFGFTLSHEYFGLRFSFGAEDFGLFHGFGLIDFRFFFPFGSENQRLFFSFGF